MNKMTLFLFVSVFALAGKSAFSAEETFEKRKSEALSQLDQRIQKLQENRACMSAAANQDALKKCHESMREWRDEKRHEMMEKRHSELKKAQ